MPEIDAPPYVRSLIAGKHVPDGYNFQNNPSDDGGNLKNIQARVVEDGINVGFHKCVLSCVHLYSHFVRNWSNSFPLLQIGHCNIFIPGL